jgi:RNA recognition motif-containing protein
MSLKGAGKSFPTALVFSSVSKVARSKRAGADFIGNLPSEKVSKRDVFQKFSRYGKLAQISIKQAYGFVQFLTVESCARAKEAEQDMQIKGRKMRK